MSSFNNSNCNSNSNNGSFDSLVLQSLMGRLQLRPPPPTTSPLRLSQSFEDLFLNPTEQHYSEDSSSEGEEEEDHPDKTPLSKEESKLEKDIIRFILTGNSQTLKPNSGQAVSIGDHHVCVAYHEEPGSDYRVWEWHGHIMLFDLENGYSPEYIYGNYFERLLVRTPAAKKEEKDVNLGLRELIGGGAAAGDSVSGRILRRGMNAAATRRF
ncbi:hypothetical protein Syun_015943 [Stephania yunnanensis]|uniref:Uncharacterized protein n=1 Tax=Stephania yunnanensis TaxID=152371 RepID=A0AAP0J400_9MAGN